MKVFWNRIKSARNPKENARTEVLNHLDRCDNYNSSCVLSERCIRKYISDMKSGSSPGIDGITPDHLRSALNSPIVFHLCKLLTVCFIFGMVPTTFKKGILVPILKKPSLDP